jgi:glycosyltransferase involved in cell wall biosynthesis
LALLEAQACGRRVVASRVGGVPTALDPASGILVPPEDPAALAQGLLMALCKAGSDGPGSTEARDFVLRTGSLERMERAYSTLMLGDTP